MSTVSIEFSGLPGSGKSTLIRSFCDQSNKFHTYSKTSMLTKCYFMIFHIHLMFLFFHHCYSFRFNYFGHLLPPYRHRLLKLFRIYLSSLFVILSSPSNTVPLYESLIHQLTSSPSDLASFFNSYHRLFPTKELKICFMNTSADNSISNMIRRGDQIDLSMELRSHYSSRFHVQTQLRNYLFNKPTQISAINHSNIVNLFIIS